MKERLMSRLFGLQKKLNSISSYNHENSHALFRYSIEFEALLGSLLKINYQKFNEITNNYTLETQKYCELGCALCEEKNREQAFSTGKNKLDLYVKECIATVVQQRT